LEVSTVLGNRRTVEPPETLPADIIYINGYANRILVFSYIFWLIVFAKTYLTLRKEQNEKFRANKKNLISNSHKKYDL
jgi:hypothetical protein